MSKLDAIKADVEKHAQIVCEGLSLELVDVNVHSYNETTHIQVFVDRPTGGIGMDECVAVNQGLDKILYEDLNFGDTYTLEVGSPGLDRPLKDFRDFRRAIGRNVHVYLRERLQGKMEYDGKVKGVRDAEIVFETKQSEMIIPIAVIEKGKQII